MKCETGQLSGVLVSEIYAALAGHGSWQEFLDHLAAILPNGKATLFYHDFAAGSGVLALNSRIEDEMTTSYNQYYSKINPWMLGAITRPLQIGTRGEQYLPQEDLLRTEFYNDFLRPQELHSGLGVTIFRDQGCNFMLSLVSGATEDSPLDAAASLLGALAPHLSHAFAFYKRAGAVASAYPIVGAATDALGAAFVAFGFGRKLLWATAAGRELLSTGDPIGIDARERIIAPSSIVKEALDSALAAALRGEGMSKRTIPVPSRGRLPPRRLTIVVPALTPFERYFGGPCVLLIVEEPKPRNLPTEDALRLGFALTPSEARLALHLSNGTALADAAAALSISKETARTHLKSVFAKMGVRRQTELVAKIHKLESPPL